MQVLHTIVEGVQYEYEVPIGAFSTPEVAMRIVDELNVALEAGRRAYQAGEGRYVSYSRYYIVGEITVFESEEEFKNAGEFTRLVGR